MDCLGSGSAADDNNDGDDNEQTVSQSRVQEGIVATRQLFDQAWRQTQIVLIFLKSLFDGL